MSRDRNFSRATILFTFFLLLPAGCAKKETAGPLLCHVGGTMRPVFEKLAELYRQETGQSIEINSADSGELLAHIELQAQGDLYVAHDPFLDVIMARGLAVDGWTLAEISPVILVQKGNPKNIRGLQDLARADVQLALTDPNASTLGRLLPTIFAKAGMDLPTLLRTKNIIIHRSGSYVANLLQMKSADAALVWGAVAILRAKDLDSVPIVPEYLPVPYVDAVTSATGKSYVLAPVRVTICSLRCSDQREQARAFMAFVTSERARPLLEEYGFRVTAQLRRQEYLNGRPLTTPKVSPGQGSTSGKAVPK
ncbi:MAG: substrate-binding domain-containing protein [Planctomycetes bacterium]|nr:substrate-binding domain-containing protein [Planctomycetota bacterium]